MFLEATQIFRHVYNFRGTWLFYSLDLSTGIRGMFIRPFLIGVCLLGKRAFNSGLFMHVKNILTNTQPEQLKRHADAHVCLINRVITYLDYSSLLQVTCDLTYGLTKEALLPDGVARCRCLWCSGAALNALVSWGLPTFRMDGSFTAGV